MRATKIIVSAFLLSGVFLGQADAASLLENQPISFGTMGVIPTSASGQIMIDLAGVTTVSGAIISTSPAQLGNYTANGFGRQTLVSVTVSQVSPLSTAGGPPGTTLSMSNFVFPEPTITNNQSKLIFDLGATLTTDGTIQDYVAGAYSGTILITVIIP